MEPVGFFERESQLDIERWFRIFFPEEATCEIRIVGFAGSEKVMVKHFKMKYASKAVAYALTYGDRATSTYFMLNPINPGSGQTARDKDVLWRNWLILDFDPVREARVSSTDQEKEAARSQCRKVFKFLADRDWPEPLVADSGNGFHLIYRINLPNTPVERDLVKDVTSILATKFDAPDSKVDRSTYNASRLTKVYGTMARKGPSTPDRPHRASKLIYVPRIVGIVPRGLLGSLVKEYRGGSATPGPIACGKMGGGLEGYGPRSRGARPDGTTVEAAVRAERYLAAFPPAVAGQHGHNTTFRAACTAGPGFGISEGQLLELMKRVYNPKCEPPWTESDLEHKVREAYRREERPRGWMLRK